MQSDLFPLDVEPEVDIYSGFVESVKCKEFFKSLEDECDLSQKSLVMYGKTLQEPRLTDWRGDKGVVYTYSGRSHIAKGWTRTLLSIRDTILKKLDISFNSCFLNLYRDGNDYIGWHADDEENLGPNGPEDSLIASLSFGATRSFQMKHKETGVKKMYDLDEGTLLLMKGRSQKDWLHRIPRQTGVHRPRLNLTFRIIKD